MENNERAYGAWGPFKYIYARVLPDGNYIIIDHPDCWMLERVWNKTQLIDTANANYLDDGAIFMHAKTGICARVIRGQGDHQYLEIVAPDDMEDTVMRRWQQFKGWSRHKRARGEV